MVPRIFPALDMVCVLDADANISVLALTNDVDILVFRVSDP